MTEPIQPGEHHFRIAETAAENLRAACDGNGLTGSQVRLVRHDTAVHALPGVLGVALKHTYVKAQKKGKTPQGEELRNREAVIARIEGLGKEIFALPATQEDITKILAAEAGHGWEMKSEEIPLPSGRREFCHVEKCLKCSGLGDYECVTCQSTGQAPCQSCAGQGGAPCAFCFGTGNYKRADGGMVPCQRCQGLGRGICSICNGQKTILCKMCNGQMKVKCLECAGSGWWTLVYTATCTLIFSFTFERAGCNAAVLELVDKIGSRALAEGGHAEIIAEAALPTPQGATIPLTALFPVSEAEFSVEGKAVPGLVAGLKGRIMKIDPFIDALVKPAMMAMMKLGKPGIARGALLGIAGKTRLTRTSLQDLPGLGKRGLYNRIVAEYGPALSDKYARAAVKYASDAIDALAHGPRLQGLAVGTVVAGVLSAGWFMAARSFVVPLLQARGLAQHILGADILVWLAGWGIAVYAIKMVATAGMQKMMSTEGPRKMQAAGNAALYALFTTLVVWLGVAFLAPVRAEWVVEILKKIGI